MERLTKKDNRGKYYTVAQELGISDKQVNPITSWIEDCEERNFGNPINKLGRIEDLGEELGCPLEFTSTPYRLSGLRKIWYHKQWCDVVRIVVYEEMTRPYMEVRCKDYKYLKMIFLDDYKNTWWLREDKSE